MRKLLERCPSCGADVFASEMRCVACDTVVRGRYAGCAFCRLEPNDLRFVELFVACRGNLKELERETGLGYWTLRGRLDDLVERKIPEFRRGAEPTRDRRAILESVARNEMTVAEAERALHHRLDDT